MAHGFPGLEYTGKHFFVWFLKHCPNVFLLPVSLFRTSIPFWFLIPHTWPDFSIRKLSCCPHPGVLSVTVLCRGVGLLSVIMQTLSGPSQHGNAWPVILQFFLSYSFPSVCFLQCLLFGYYVTSTDFLFFTTFFCSFLPLISFYCYAILQAILFYYHILNFQKLFFSFLNFPYFTEGSS